LIPAIAVNRESGALFVVWEDARFSGGLREGIAFSKSTDGGLNWTTPVQINKVPEVGPSLHRSLSGMTGEFP
jgi:hypothetical protein